MSTFGTRTPKARCYDFWMDFLQCLSEEGDKEPCKAVADDYLECLHHKKETARHLQIRAEAKRQELEAAAKEHGHGGH